VFRIRSPKLHDNVQGIRVRIRRTRDRDATFTCSEAGRQDTLVAEITGSAVVASSSRAA